MSLFSQPGILRSIFASGPLKWSACKNTPLIQRFFFSPPLSFPSHQFKFFFNSYPLSLSSSPLIILSSLSLILSPSLLSHSLLSLSLSSSPSMMDADEEAGGGRERPRWLAADPVAPPSEPVAVVVTIGSDGGQRGQWIG